MRTVRTEVDTETYVEIWKKSLEGTESSRLQEMHQIFMLIVLQYLMFNK